MSTQSFSKMSALLHAVWPAVSTIDWSQYCSRRISAYDDADVPKYTGLIMHRSGGGCVGASTTAVGFLPRPETSAIVVVKKTKVLVTYPEIKTSLERRDPGNGFWGGGIRCSNDPSIGYALSGQPEIVDHILDAQMMRECGLLTADDWRQVTDPDTYEMIDAREHVGMSTEAYVILKRHIFDVVQEALPKIHSA